MEFSTIREESFRYFIDSGMIKVHEMDFNDNFSWLEYNYPEIISWFHGIGIVVYSIVIREHGVYFHLSYIDDENILYFNKMFNCLTEFKNKKLNFIKVNPVN